MEEQKKENKITWFDKFRLLFRKPVTLDYSLIPKDWEIADVLRFYIDTKILLIQSNKK